MRLLSASTSVTVTETVVIANAARVRVLRSDKDSRMTRNVGHATGGSAKACAAACGDADDHSVARERSHAAKKLSRVVTVLGVKQA